MATTYKEATETKVFVFNYNGDIEETTLAEHVLASVQTCTHHTGVMPTYAVEELTGDIYKNAAGVLINEDQYNDLSEEDQDECTYFGEGIIGYATVSRNSYQRGFQIDQKFETEDEANDYFFTQVEKYDFQRDDSRSTEYYSTWSEAAEVLAEREQ